MNEVVNTPIEDVGLEPYLNSTKHLHNDLNYIIFDLCIESRIGRAGIARLFNVNEKTVRKWVLIYTKEKIGGK